MTWSVLTTVFLIVLYSVNGSECDNAECKIDSDNALQLLQLSPDGLGNMDENLFRDAISNVGYMKLGMSSQTKNMMQSVSIKLKNWFKSLKNINLKEEMDEKFFLSYWLPSNPYFGYVNQRNSVHPAKPEQFFFPQQAMYNYDVYPFPFINDTDIINAISFMINECNKIFDNIWKASSFFNDNENDLKLILGDKPQFWVLVNYYSPDNDDDNVLGQNEHSDHGLITLLYADSDGLQIKYDSKWYDINMENDLILNFGDLLSIITNNRFKATVHRVEKMTKHDRLSIGIFMDPDTTGHLYKYNEKRREFVKEMTLHQYMDMVKTKTNEY